MSDLDENPMAPPQRLRWLYVDFNSYFASVEQQLDPRLRGKPIAVIPVETESTCAIAASYEAKAFGIKTGTPVWEAKKLCPDLICVLGRHNHYVEFHERILDEIDKHIPVTKVCSIDEMACQLMKNEVTVARTTEIAQSIKAGIAKNIGEYVRCSIGVATSKYLAKVATDMKKPDGFTILQPDDLHRLLELKLRDLPALGPTWRSGSIGLAFTIWRSFSGCSRNTCALSGAASGAKKCGITCAATTCRIRRHRQAALAIAMSCHPICALQRKHTTSRDA